MELESNAFRRESSESSRENKPKERETGNGFSTYGFSRGPLGVLRNQDRSECFFESKCKSLIKQSQAEKQKSLHQGLGSLSRLRSNSTSRSERGSTSRNQAGFRVETLLLAKRALIARLRSSYSYQARSPPILIISRGSCLRFVGIGSPPRSPISQCSQIPDPLVSDECRTNGVSAFLPKELM
ncbi:hypothetical protein V6N13_019759 [Hibiscus sabdariffa]